MSNRTTGSLLAIVAASLALAGCQPNGNQSADAASAVKFFFAAFSS